MTAALKTPVEIWSIVLDLVLQHPYVDLEAQKVHWWITKYWANEAAADEYEANRHSLRAVCSIWKRIVDLKPTINDLGRTLVTKEFFAVATGNDPHVFQRLVILQLTSEDEDDDQLDEKLHSMEVSLPKLTTIICYDEVSHGTLIPSSNVLPFINWKLPALQNLHLKMHGLDPQIALERFGQGLLNLEMTYASNVAENLQSLWSLCPKLETIQDTLNTLVELPAPPEGHPLHTVVFNDCDFTNIKTVFADIYANETLWPFLDAWKKNIKVIAIETSWRKAVDDGLELVNTEYPHFSHETVGNLAYAANERGLEFVDACNETLAARKERKERGEDSEDSEEEGEADGGEDEDEEDGDGDEEETNEDGEEGKEDDEDDGADR